ncbi:unnamed protein product [Amoebophrya sp. A120]|nr:unnamed protein product [Amoebophrya sp. A120]|eukprot:GSA120T00024189001.1
MSSTSISFSCSSGTTFFEEDPQVQVLSHDDLDNPSSCSRGTGRSSRSSQLRLFSARTSSSLSSSSSSPPQHAGRKNRCSAIPGTRSRSRSSLCRRGIRTTTRRAIIAAEDFLPARAVCSTSARSSSSSSGFVSTSTKRNSFVATKRRRTRTPPPPPAFFLQELPQRRSSFTCAPVDKNSASTAMQQMNYVEVEDETSSNDGNLNYFTNTIPYRREMTARHGGSARRTLRNNKLASVLTTLVLSSTLLVEEQITLVQSRRAPVGTNSKGGACFGAYVCPALRLAEDRPVVLHLPASKAQWKAVVESGSQGLTRTSSSYLSQPSQQPKSLSRTESLPASSILSGSTNSGSHQSLSSLDSTNNGGGTTTLVTEERLKQISKELDDSESAPMPELRPGQYLRARMLQRVPGVREAEVPQALPTLRSKLLTVEDSQVYGMGGGSGDFLGGGGSDLDIDDLNSWSRQTTPGSDASKSRPKGAAKVGSTASTGSAARNRPRWKFFVSERLVNGERDNTAGLGGRRGVMSCLAPDVILLYPSFYGLIEQVRVAIKEERLNNCGSFIQDDDDLNTTLKDGCNVGVLKGLGKSFRRMFTSNGSSANPGVGDSVSNCETRCSSGYASSSGSPNSIRPAMSPYARSLGSGPGPLSLDQGSGFSSPTSMVGGRSDSFATSTDYMGASRSDVIKCIRDPELTRSMRDQGSLPEHMLDTTHRGLMDVLPPEAAEEFAKTGNWVFVQESDLGLSLATSGSSTPGGALTAGGSAIGTPTDDWSRGSTPVQMAITGLLDDPATVPGAAPHPLAGDRFLMDLYSSMTTTDADSDDQMVFFHNLPSSASRQSMQWAWDQWKQFIYGTMTQSSLAGLAGGAAAHHSTNALQPVSTLYQRQTTDPVSLFAHDYVFELENEYGHCRGLYTCDASRRDLERIYGLAHPNAGVGTYLDNRIRFQLQIPEQIAVGAKKEAGRLASDAQLRAKPGFPLKAGEYIELEVNRPAMSTSVAHGTNALDEDNWTLIESVLDYKLPPEAKISAVAEAEESRLQKSSRFASRSPTGDELSSAQSRTIDPRTFLDATEWKRGIAKRSDYTSGSTSSDQSGSSPVVVGGGRNTLVGQQSSFQFRNEGQASPGSETPRRRERTVGSYERRGLISEDSKNLDSLTAKFSNLAVSTDQTNHPSLNKIAPAVTALPELAVDIQRSIVLSEVALQRLPGSSSSVGVDHMASRSATGPPIGIGRSVNLVSPWESGRPLQWGSHSMVGPESQIPDAPKNPITRLHSALARAFRYDRKLHLKQSSTKLLYCTNSDVVMLSAATIGGMTGFLPFQKPAYSKVAAPSGSSPLSAHSVSERSATSSGGTPTSTTSSQNLGAALDLSTDSLRRRGAAMTKNKNAAALITSKSRTSSTLSSSKNSPADESPVDDEEDGLMSNPNYRGLGDTFRRGRYYDTIVEARKSRARSVPPRALQEKSQRFRVDQKLRSTAPLIQCRREQPANFCAGRYRCGLEPVPVHANADDEGTTNPGDGAAWDSPKRSLVRVPRDLEGQLLNTFDIVIPEYHQMADLKEQGIHQHHTDSLPREVAYQEGARLKVGDFLTVEVEDSYGKALASSQTLETTGGADRAVAAATGQENKAKAAHQNDARYWRRVKLEKLAQSRQHRNVRAMSIGVFPSATKMQVTESFAHRTLQEDQLRDLLSKGTGVLASPRQRNGLKSEDSRVRSMGSKDTKLGRSWLKCDSSMEVKLGGKALKLLFERNFGPRLASYPVDVDHTDSQEVTCYKIIDRRIFPTPEAYKNFGVTTVAEEKEKQPPRRRTDSSDPDDPMSGGGGPGGPGSANGSFGGGSGSFGGGSSGGGNSGSFGRRNSNDSNNGGGHNSGGAFSRSLPSKSRSGFGSFPRAGAAGHPGASPRVIGSSFSEESLASTAASTTASVSVSAAGSRLGSKTNYAGGGSAFFPASQEVDLVAGGGTTSSTKKSVRWDDIKKPPRAGAQQGAGLDLNPPSMLSTRGLLYPQDHDDFLDQISTSDEDNDNFDNKSRSRQNSLSNMCSAGPCKIIQRRRLQSELQRRLDDPPLFGYTDEDRQKDQEALLRLGLTA